MTPTLDAARERPMSEPPRHGGVPMFGASHRGRRRDKVIVMRAAIKALMLMALLVSTPSVYAARWGLASDRALPAHGARVLEKFAKEVSASSRGALEMKRLESTGSVREVRGGQVAVAAIALADIAAEEPVLTVDEVPFLAVNFIEARKLWSVLRPQIESSLSRQGLVLLFALPHSPKGMLSNRRLAQIRDVSASTLVLDGGQLDVLARLTKARGVRGDAKSLLAGGKADLTMMSAADAVSAKAWEFARYYYHAPAWFPKHLVVANRNAVVALRRETRDALLNASDAAEASAWNAAERETEERVQNLRDRGVKVRQPSVDFLIELEQLGRNLLFVWSDRAGEAGAEIVEAYYAIK